MTRTELRHFVLPHTLSPKSENVAWYGLKRIYGYPLKIKRQMGDEERNAHKVGCISEREAEVDLFLSILEGENRELMHLVELGAGWGEWCMAMAGVVSSKLIRTRITDYRCLGVEADYTYYQAMRQNFSEQGLTCTQCTPVWRAVSNYQGTSRFNCSSHFVCGGSLARSGLGGSAIKGALWDTYHKLTRQDTAVVVTTLDRLLEEEQMHHVDILHIDVQGSEIECLEGARTTIERGDIDYLIVGIHHPRIGRDLQHRLQNRYDLLADLQAGLVTRVETLPPVWIAKGQDGLQLYERRGRT